MDQPLHSGANENAGRYALEPKHLRAALHRHLSAFRTVPPGFDHPLDFSLIVQGALNDAAEYLDLAKQIISNHEPVFAVLTTWDDEVAALCQSAGAAACFDGAMTAEALGYQITATLNERAVLPGGLKELRWLYDWKSEVVTLSPALRQFFDLEGEDTSLGLEQFLIALAGLSATHILEGLNASFETRQTRRLVHPLTHPNLSAFLGRYVAHETTCLGDGETRGTLVCGTLSSDISAQEYLSARTSKSALSEQQFISALDGFLSGQSKRIGLSAAVCVLSIDRFEQMNVLLGRQLADELLERVAERLKAILSTIEGEREDGDVRAIALGRLGGAQFAIAMEGAVLIHEASAVARQILTSFQAPFTIADQRLYLDARIGIAVAGAAESNADKILSRANVALYQAFKDPPGTYRVFNASHAAEAQERVILDAELRDALSHDNLFIRYMPIIDLQTHQAVGVEALVRWNHPEMGLLSPELFIPMAEETGVIADVGDWVLHHALQEFSHAAATLPADFHLSINVSSEQFRRGDLEQSVVNQLYAAGLDESRLTLEITESLVIENFKRAREIMGALKDRGISWSIDDFGTGFSALSYLSQLQFDEIKLDRSFVKALAQSDDSAAPSTVVDAVVAIAKSYKASIVAEGIESTAQASALKSRGCDYGQGFGFSEPLSIRDLVRYVDGQAAIKGA